MNRAQLIESLKQDTLVIIEEVKALAKLDEEILTMKADAKRWSILECIEHLNIADAHYLMQFDKKLRIATPSQNMACDSTYLGKLFINKIKPRADGSIPSPMKTMRKFDPDVTVHKDTISKFLEDQQELLKYLDMCQRLDLQKIKIPSALGAIITFRLGDALQFLIGHNQRHIIQAKNVLKELGQESVLVS
ncbi:DinB family protein [Reichenbachiella agarivorans]|uniref:DinB family protein n=1 Tax=Reichenbachiella agarivorans TaxID=2979464 RepID=A0ABY6CQC1_9BACT|nr:DinB family protein [Reichenbachiella agarivorans]UXP32716.1 DinB family protein [Reichenbachiella agarivorans]